MCAEYVPSRESDGNEMRVSSNNPTYNNGPVVLKSHNYGSFLFLRNADVMTCSRSSLKIITSCLLKIILREFGLFYSIIPPTF